MDRIEGLARYACRGNRDWSEMIPVAMAAYIEAVDCYDPSRGSLDKFTAARTVNAVRDELRLNSRIVRVPGRSRGGKRYGRYAEQAMRPMHRGVVLSRRRSHDFGPSQVDVDDVLGCLPYKLAYLLRRRMQGDRGSEISHSLGMNRSHEYTLHKRAGALAMRAMHG